jgi:hypothetical protein
MAVIEDRWEGERLRSPQGLIGTKFALIKVEKIVMKGVKR